MYELFTREVRPKIPLECTNGIPGITLNCYYSLEKNCRPLS